jgi:outer membrane receptor protein involved in Fe transport
MSVRPSIRKYAAISVVFLALAAPARAQVETVMVTAARLPDPVGSAAFSVTKVDSDTLLQFDQLDAALEQVPGLSLFRRSTSLNSNATTEGVSLREIAPSGASRALVMLDGVPMNDPFGGWVIWSALPAEDIGAAEVVRGAGAGPYGAGALTGTILLSERDTTDGVAIADASAGTLGTYRAGASGGTELGKIDLFASATGERSDGWIPAEPPGRGAADNHLWFGAGEASLRAQSDLGGGVTASARLEYYDEARGAGEVGATSDAKGLLGSATVERAANGDTMGWRLQAWTIDSMFSNVSVSIAPDHSSTTPANDQYAIPALGYGFNAAALGQLGDFRWEAGADLRNDQGQSKELYSFKGTAFTMDRRSGGMQTTGGLYGETAYDTGEWLLTLGARGDYWSVVQGHLVQAVRATGAVTTDTDYPDRSGLLPTARGGVRRNFDTGFLGSEYLRAAAYEGFRVPTLNEYFRPFRVGNNNTLANAGLKPERLYGAEIGWGGVAGAFSWNATGFWNLLHDAVANVTQSSSPAGTTYKRENAGDVDALGFEGDAAWRLDDAFTLRSAVSLTDARVQSAQHYPQINGNRPAQAPLATITGGASWTPISRLRLDADLHWESDRFEDDQNTLPLGSAFVLDLRASWFFHPDLSLFAAVYNATNSDIATGETSTITIGPSTREVTSLGQPRTFEVGLSYAP